MKVVVDRDRCQEHGQCVFAAPEVFQLDADGHLVYVGSVDPVLREAVEEAADMCPMQAITVAE